MASQPEHRKDSDAQIRRISEFRKGPKSKKQSQPAYTPKGITRLTVAGFKSISREQSIEIRPLTILAGANSSGKSSIMQPLLLLKQTLEAPYDPGAILLDGPNVRFSSADQMLSRIHGQKVNSFHVGIQIDNGATIIPYYVKGKNTAFDVEQMVYEIEGKKQRFYSDMTQTEIIDLLPVELKKAFPKLEIPMVKESKVSEQLYIDSPTSYRIMRNRCFLTLEAWYSSGLLVPIPNIHQTNTIVEEQIRQLIHLPGLRGNPQRTYPVAAVEATFPGSFESYFASVIRHWQAEGNKDKLRMLNNDLVRLGLTSNVVAEPINDTQVELRVNRFKQSQGTGSKDDMVNIADVGLGVSQTLPVLVALHVAENGQLLYLEQPELHLHPRAQYGLAEVLADAAMRGNHMVVETHSSLLLLGIQTLVAEGKLPPELVKLHWFTSAEDGSTEVTSADLDANGAFGDWPEDFAMVALDSESRYLDAQSHRVEM